MKLVTGWLAALMVALTMSAAFATDVPELKGHVNDNANIISPAAEQQLEAELSALEQKTTAQVAILTVPSLGGETIDQYGTDVASSWKLGQKGVDNGLLITYTTDGDHSRIDVGYGLEGAIPDGKAGDIIRDDFRRYAPKVGTKDFDQAFLSTEQAIASIVIAEYQADSSGKSLQGTKFPTGLVVMLVVAFFAGAVTESMMTFGGAVTGGVVGFLFGVIGGISGLGIVIATIVCAFIGLIAKYILEGVAASGGSSSSGYSSSSSSGSGGGGFSGGGGGFGGGGASD
jgi:uncharacterized protein